MSALSLRRFASLAVAVTLLTAGARGQDGRTVPHAPSALPKTDASAALLYNVAGANITSNSRFWMQGGGADVSVAFFHHLSMAANIYGLHAGNSGKGNPVNLLVIAFGPRYTYTFAHKKHAPSIFGQALVGEVDGFSGLYPQNSGPNPSANALAVQAGGGLDIGLTNHLSVRLVQADWLYNQLPNSTTNVENNLRLGAGIVFHTRPR